VTPAAHSPDYRDNFLIDEDLDRLKRALARIRDEFRYESVDVRAVSISLIRVECVKLAAKLKMRSEDDGQNASGVDR